MKTVLIFGTFDVIHRGHNFFLQESAKQGDRIIAVIARDSFVLKTKNRIPVHSEQDRIRHILKSGLVDDAYLADKETGSYLIIEKIKPQVVCFGHDQIQLADSFKNWLKGTDFQLKVVIIDPFKRDKYSSTLRNKKHY